MRLSQKRGLLSTAPTGDKSRWKKKMGGHLLFCPPLQPLTCVLTNVSMWVCRSPAPPAPAWLGGCLLVRPPGVVRPAPFARPRSSLFLRPCARRPVL